MRRTKEEVVSHDSIDVTLSISVQYYMKENFNKVYYLVVFFYTVEYSFL